MVPLIKFTHEISCNSVNFLDTKVIKNSMGDINTDVYQKPTDTHSYLHWTSAHPPHLKYRIPYSQALRLRRICSSNDILEQRLMDYSNFFVTCGYKRNRVLSDMWKVLSLTQEESLRARDRGTTNRIPLVTTHNPHTTFIAETTNRHWYFLESKKRSARILHEPQLIAYRRPKSLRDTLVSAKMRGKTPGENTRTGGCGPCNKPQCSWCTRINKTSTFTGTQEDRSFDIYHVVNCQSTWLIYFIECNICNLQYVGKSETGFNIRLNNHRNHIKKAFCGCEITEHFLLKPKTHNFDNDVTITIIEQTKRIDMTVERRKELLRKRERVFFTSWTIKSEKCTRAHVQESKSIYLSIYLSIWKPFWIYIYIYIYII